MKLSDRNNLFLFKLFLDGNKRYKWMHSLEFDTESSIRWAYNMKKKKKGKQFLPFYPSAWFFLLVHKSFNQKTIISTEFTYKIHKGILFRIEILLLLPSK